MIRRWWRLRFLAGSWLGAEAALPDLERAVRGAGAIVGALLLAVAAPAGLNPSSATISALGLSLIDIRGPYWPRLVLLSAITLILGVSAGLGGLAGGHLAGAVAVGAALSLATGIWRHLSADFGPTVGIYSLLLFMLGLGTHGGWNAAGRDMGGALAGGALAILAHVALWPIRPQHELRQGVAACWMSAGEIADAVNSMVNAPPAQAHHRLAASETALRAALDKGRALLAAPREARRPSLVAPLRRLVESADSLGRQLAAFQAACEIAAAGAGDTGPRLSSQPAIFESLSNTARAIGIAVVSRQGSHLAMARLRIRRVGGLLQAWRRRLPMECGAAAPALSEVLRQIEELLAAVAVDLKLLVRSTGAGEGFAAELLDLQAWRLRPVAAALNLSLRPEIVLVRHTFRLALLMGVGVAFVECSNGMHAYWAPLTIAIVLQPDYGSTRRKAMQRLLGTASGAAAASLSFGVRWPLSVLAISIAGSAGLFLFLVRRNYSVAVFFVTLFIVWLTETRDTVTARFTLERLANTLGGGIVAVLAAYALWPSWERQRLPAILAAALRANAAYLRAVAIQIDRGEGFSRDTQRTKREAEAANGNLFASLERMKLDPETKRDPLEKTAVLANGILRFTRRLNLLATQLHRRVPLAPPLAGTFAENGSHALLTLASAVTGTLTDPAALEAATARLNQTAPEEIPLKSNQSERAGGQWMVQQLAGARAELGALLIGAAPDDLERQSRL